MDIQFLLFFLFACIAFASAFLTITTHNPVYSVLFLILTFCNITGILLLSEIEFLGIILVIIYVGAIAVLFIFVIMMLDISVIKKNFEEKLNFIFITGLFIGLFFIETFFIMGEFFFKGFNYPLAFIFNNWVNFIDNITNIETLGQVLYTYYSLFFLVAGIILLIALLGSVMLTLNKDLIPRKQKIYKQLSSDHSISIFNTKLKI